MNDSAGPCMPWLVWVCRTVALLPMALAGCESMHGLQTVEQSEAEPTVRQASATVPVKKPGKHWLRVSQYVFYSDVPLEATDTLFRDLESLPETVQKELHLPPGEQLIQVYLFESHDRYVAFMKERYPSLPVRRAYFIADPKRPGLSEELQVYTWMGDHIRIDLRHELTHAVLHGVLKNVPLWLDEGLAGYFEQPKGMDGVNPSHLKEIANGPFQPDLARLEKLDDVKQMEKKEYQESWAWAHFLMKNPAAKEVLIEYIGKLKDDPEPGPILPALEAAVGDCNRALFDHLAKTRVPPPLP